VVPSDPGHELPPLAVLPVAKFVVPPLPGLPPAGDAPPVTRLCVPPVLGVPPVGHAPPVLGLGVPPVSTKVVRLDVPPV